MKKSLLISIILAVLLVTLVGCNNQSQWNDGAYDGTAEGMHGEMAVKVNIESGKISDIKIISQNETAGVGDVAIEKIPKEIISTQSIEVEAVSGASESSKTIIAAVEDALNKAAK